MTAYFVHVKPYEPDANPEPGQIKSTLGIAFRIRQVDATRLLVNKAFFLCFILDFPEEEQMETD